MAKVSGLVNEEFSQAGSLGGMTQRARPEHLESLVECHMLSLVEDVITLLGREFLRRHYAYYLAQPDAVCLVTVDPPTGTVTGFILGGNPDLRGRFIRSHLLFSLWTIFIKSIRYRRVRQRFCEPLWESLGRFLRMLGLLRPRQEIPADPPGSYAQMLFLGTHPDFRRKNMGKLVSLVCTIHEECVKMGYKVTRLTTDVDNPVTNVLYPQVGWKLIGTAKGLNYYRRETIEDLGKK